MKTITEAKYKDSVNKIKSFLADKRNLSSNEINYVVSFYEQVKNLGILRADYFKDFPHEGELFDLDNIEKFAKYPEAFYDVVMVVLHNEAFLSIYDVKFDGFDVTLTKKSKKDKEQDIVETSSNLPPEYAKYKVGEDNRYYTFGLPNHIVAHSFMNFYKKMWPDDRELLRFGSKFDTSWCTMSSNNAENFERYKPTKSSIWLVTFLKVNPVKEVIKQINNIHNTSYKTLYEIPSVESKLSYEKVRDVLGEKVLLDENGQMKNASRTGKKHGYFNFSNYPGSAMENSNLEIAPTYDYSLVAQGINTNPFDIDGGVLRRYLGASAIVSIPVGVTEIAEGAFSGLRKVHTIILPPSLRVIRSGAFSGIVGTLRFVVATNNLEVVESGAFGSNPTMLRSRLTEMHEYISGKSKAANIKNFILFGIIEPSNKSFSYIIKKPANLRFYPRLLRSNYEKFEAITKGEAKDEA